MEKYYEDDTFFKLTEALYHLAANPPRDPFTGEPTHDADHFAVLLGTKFDIWPESSRPLAADVGNFVARRQKTPRAHAVFAMLRRASARAAQRDGDIALPTVEQADLVVVLRSKGQKLNDALASLERITALPTVEQAAIAFGGHAGVAEALSPGVADAVRANLERIWSAEALTKPVGEVDETVG